MVKHFSIYLAIFILISCNSNNKQSSEITISKDSLVNNGNPRYSYKFNVDSTGYILTSINIYSESKCIQKITTKKDIESKHFELIDWNFDGYKDISVLSNCGSGGCVYWIWNYNPNSGTYEYNKELSEVLGLEMDSKQKHIIFHYRFGDQDEYWKYYDYKNNKLVYIKEISN